MWPEFIQVKLDNAAWLDDDTFVTDIEEAPLVI